MVNTAESVDIEGLLSGLMTTKETLRQGIRTKEVLHKKEINLRKDIAEDAERAEVMDQAQQLLGAVSDSTVGKMLDYVTGVINKVLADMFKDTGSGYELTIEKSIYRNKYVHLSVNIVEYPAGVERDLRIQNGEGIQQVISFLYVLCLIEVNSKRKILFMDELLNGLHKDAAEVIAEIIEVFTKGGYQFIMVDHNNFGTTSLLNPLIERLEVKKLDGVSTITEQELKDESE